MAQVDRDGNILREYRDPLAHHDQNHLDDGKVLYTTLEPLTHDQAITVKGGAPSTEARGHTVYADCIKLVEPWAKSNFSSSADFEAGGSGGAQLLWYWRAIDHLDPSLFPLHPDYPREHWPLINSVSFDSSGNIIASLRSTSSVIIISRETGKILWHLPAPTVAQQHCAYELPGPSPLSSSSGDIEHINSNSNSIPGSSSGSGNILIFDNGVFRDGVTVPHSRAIIVSIATKKVIWEYKDRSTGGLGFFTPFMGSAQMLTNGNVLLCEAATGRIFEVTKSGRMVWEFVVSQLNNYRELMTGLGDHRLEELEKMGFTNESNAIFRAYKYSPDEVKWLLG